MRQEDKHSFTFSINGSVYRFDDDFRENIISDAESEQCVKKAWFNGTRLHQEIKYKGKTEIETIDVIDVFQTCGQDANEKLSSIGISPLFSPTNIAEKNNGAASINIKDFS